MEQGISLLLRLIVLHHATSSVDTVLVALLNTRHEATHHCHIILHLFKKRRMHTKKTQRLRHSIPVAQKGKHGACNAKVMRLIPKEYKNCQM